MTAAQLHRGPDDFGHIGIESRIRWIEELPREERESFSRPVDLLFGFRRLSILDLSEKGHQPMLSSDGQVALMLNGEIYNAFGFVPELKAAGCRFRGRSDTEVVLNLYLAYGLDGMLSRLNGMFAIAIYDGRVGKLFLARDRFGIKPLYLLDCKNYFAFSSELKSFGHLPGYQFTLAPAGLSEFLLFRNNRDQTLFEDISQLAAGSVLIYDPMACTSVLRNYSTASGDVGIENSAQFAVLLEAAVKSQMISDVPLGCQLSGGVDSSLVTSFAARVSPGNMHTVSILFEDGRYSEAEYIDHVERTLGVKGHRFTLSSDYYLDHLDTATWHLEQPIGHPNTIGVMLISEQARQFVTVLLSGEGADELLAGYSRFLGLMQPWGRYFLSRLRIASGSRMSFMNGYRDPAWRAVTASSVNDTAMARSVFPSMDAELALEPRINLYQSQTGDRLTRLRKYEMATYLPDLLVRQDKMSMANSIENRVPFLDNTLVDSAFGLRPNQLLGRRGGKPHGKLILKEICEKVFGHRFTYRDKKGFGIPLRAFLSQDKFQNVLKQRILPGIGARDVFNLKPIEAAARNLASAEPADIQMLWSMVAFEVWAQQFLDAKFEQHVPGG